MNKAEGLLETSDFERCLRIGLGRPLLYLRQHDSTPYRDLILDACLHNTAYDTQVEGYKSDYMMEIIKLTNEVDFYRQHILDATAKINDDTNERDAGHLVALTAQFAIDGDQQARQIIYELVENTFEDEWTLGVSAIIAIDKLDGFVYIADKLVPIKQQNNDEFWDNYLLFLLEDVMGKSDAQSALVTLRKTNLNVNTYLNYVEAYQAERTKHQNQRSEPKAMPYEELKDKIVTSAINLRKWGETATHEDLLLAAHDLTQLDDPILISRYLRIFRRVPFPLEPELLFRFMNVESLPSGVSIPALTITALSNIQHLSMRKFALQLIDEDRFAERAISLLARNFEHDDWMMIEEMSEKALDTQKYHDLGFSVQDVFKQNPDPRATKTLLNIYEYGPCSMCRDKILQMLHSIQGLTDSIRQECLYDANPYIREWAQNV